MGSINGSNIASPLQDKTPCSTAKTYFKDYMYTLWETIPVENTIIMSSEDLDSNPQYIWERLSKTIGLGNNDKHPKMEEFQKVRYNTQVKWGSKGESNKVSIDEFKPGLYFASKFKAVFESTRKALNKCWYDDCMWISKVTGHRYSCLTMPTTSKELVKNKNLKVEVDPSIDSYKLNTYLNEAFPKSNLSLGFFQRAIRKCMEQFNYRNKSEVTTTSFKSKQNGINQYHIMDNAILLLSLSKKDRIYMKHLLRYSADIQYFIEESDHSSSVININKEYTKPIIISSDPKKIKIINQNGNKLKNTNFKSKGEVYLTLTNSSCCKYRNINVAFKYVIIVVKDAMGIIWTKYQKSLGFLNGLKETDFIFLNWTHWETSAIGMLVNESNDPVAQTFWANENSLMIDAIPSNNKKIIIIEDIRFSQSKLIYLYEVIKFIKNIFIHNNNDILPVNVTSNSLSCANILSNYDVGLSNTQDYVSKSNIDLAYASDDLVCSVKKYFSNSSLQLESLSLPQVQLVKMESVLMQGKQRCVNCDIQRELLLQLFPITQSHYWQPLD